MIIFHSLVWDFGGKSLFLRSFLSGQPINVFIQLEFRAMNVVLLQLKSTCSFKLKER